MGHLLGTAPPRAYAASRMTSPASERTWTIVKRVERHDPGPAIAAFAIDAPLEGSRTPGAGLEIDGWVIGADTPVAAIQVRAESGDTPRHPLSGRRPDVANDYPAFPHAASSGFFFWHHLGIEPDSWSVAVEAVLPDGERRPLATVTGFTDREPCSPGSGHRLVDGPDFVIIGTQRGGTTSLHAFLNAHPHVVTPAKKELHFLTDRHGRGRDWYLGQFPAELPWGILTGEATPYALFHPLAPTRLQQVAPQAKLIALLRNPVDRAYSQYLMESARGDEVLSFRDALAAESTRLAGEEERLVTDPAYISWAHNHLSYVRRGEYASQLERWFDHFPREQFMLLRSEDLYQQPDATLDRVTAFLGLPPGETGHFTAHNRSSGPPLDAEIRARLARHFAPWNERLADLLGWDPQWK